MQRKTTIALLYDFDKTLTTRDMQEYTFIPALGLSAEEFWRRANDLAKREQMDRILAYMKLMLDESRRQQKPIRRSDFVALGSQLEFFSGVEGWFDLVNEAGEALRLAVQHFIISSGLKEIIEGSKIGDRFERIYACEYLYDENGVAVWPKLAVNYTAKTQFLFRINKGVLSVSEDEPLNAYTAEGDRPVPFRNMIYIGDGLTDVPTMKLVKESGGASIAVHTEHTLHIAQRLMNEGRINYYTPADYTPSGLLFALVRTIFEKLSAQNRLEYEMARLRREASEARLHQ
ncbi:MAG: haloacid dehalogenase-like hydrolase [Sphaerochaeta sp.]|jgi:2-hydroxy-3-keto-5-methylthiopentenyl-1-phosphate phosphatase|nr:haloacid dehalogenase-like hydrolase [Sphaerochaeta sp.]